MKEILHHRTIFTPLYTLGALRLPNGVKFITMEHACRLRKIYGKTAIPANTYHLGRREMSPMARDYEARFPEWHTEGMLHIQRVLSFTYIYPHIGNTLKDTLGCVLVGSQLRDIGWGHYRLTDSVAAYKALYKAVIEYDIDTWRITTAPNICVHNPPRSGLTKILKDSII